MIHTHTYERGGDLPNSVRLNGTCATGREAAKGYDAMAQSLVTEVDARNAAPWRPSVAATREQPRRPRKPRPAPTRTVVFHGRGTLRPMEPANQAKICWMLVSVVQPRPHPGWRLESGVEVRLDATTNVVRLEPKRDEHDVGRVSTAHSLATTRRRS